ncbi:twin-arginine translocase subunit TatB [bacterium]|nr:twin-arginine translocase subunit TatB [bacterium]
MNIGFQELLLISVLALIILGPDRLPAAVRTFTLWSSRLKASINQIKQDIGEEINIDEIRRDVHNEELMRTLEKKRHSSLLNPSIDPSIKNTHEESHDPFLDGDDYLDSSNRDPLPTNNDTSDQPQNDSQQATANGNKTDNKPA